MKFDLAEISDLHHTFCDCHYWTTTEGTEPTNLVLELLCEFTDCPTLLDRLDADEDGFVDMNEFGTFL